MLTFQQSFLWNCRLRLSEPRQRAAECFTSRVVGRRKSIRRTRKLRRDSVDESRRTTSGHRDCATYSKYIDWINRKFLFSTDKNILNNWFNQNRGWRNNFLDQLNTRLTQCHQENTIIAFSFLSSRFLSRRKWNTMSFRMAHLTYTNTTLTIWFLQN